VYGRGYTCVKKISWIRAAVSTEQRLVTDRRTDTGAQHTPHYANASRGKNATVTRCLQWTVHSRFLTKNTERITDIVRESIAGDFCFSRIHQMAAVR